MEQAKNWGVELSYSIEDTPLGTAGSVRMAAGDTKEPVLVISGDAMTDFDLANAVQAHEKTWRARDDPAKKRCNFQPNMGLCLRIRQDL